MNSKLKKIRVQLDQGLSPNPVSVRTFLSWFGALRRGAWIVQYIKDELSNARIKVEPDFDLVWIDSEITFSDSVAPASVLDVADNTVSDTDKNTGELEINVDPAFRLSRFLTSRSGVTSIGSGASLLEAMTVMSINKFSQLPIMDKPNHVIGIVSWESIGQKSLQNISISKAIDASVQAATLVDTSSIFDAMYEIEKNDYILIKSSNGFISGIMTATDLGVLFRELAEPFLLLNEIENYIRILLSGSISVSEIRNACSDNDVKRKDKIANVGQLTLGECIRLLESPDIWAKLPVSADRATVIKILGPVREIRNDVMHFDPGADTPERISQLRKVSRFFRELLHHKITRKS